MRRAASLVMLLGANASWGMETQVLPQSAFIFDFGYLRTSLNKQWSGDGQALPLVPENRRYEPGAGLQGVLRARPEGQFDFLLVQVLYGITDRLTAALYLPLVLHSRVSTNFSWEEGDYSSQLGRKYTQDDFWEWASSMGQQRVPAAWESGVQLSDIVVGARYLLPQFEWMTRSFFRWSASLQVALPTGSNFDPEEAISVGTNLWELHAAGDVEAHLSADKHFLVDEYGVYRLNVGADLSYAFFRPRQYFAGHGVKNPLLNNTAAYVGDSYLVDGGDWVAGTVSFDAVPFIGPARASLVSGGSLEAAQALPPMVMLTLSYTRVQTFQSDWKSQSPQWDYEREKYWQPGEKNIVRVGATVSLLRVGLPLQVYARYQSSDLIPGRYTRPANVFSAGVRLVAKFW